MKLKAFIIILLISIFTLVGCASTKNIYEEEGFVPTVENSTIIYGCKDGIGSLKLLIQSETEDYRLLNATCSILKGVFFVKVPLKIDTEIKVLSSEYIDFVYDIFGRSKSVTVKEKYLMSGVDFVIIQPGLQYIDFFYQDDPENRDKREKHALKILSKDIKDPQRKALIKERLEELSK